MQPLTATYSPDDNKFRLYASTRLDADTYARVKGAGFKWAPRQDLFVAPMWTPHRADLLMELCGEIGDEDTSLTDRAEERADRFDGYREHRAADAESARHAVASIADNIPLGQPILIGHHSERHARRDAERIEQGMRRAVRMWETAEYWRSRAAGAIRHAKYKELPAVRARRIKTIEADRRKEQRTIDQARDFVRLWGKMDDPAKDGSPCTPELRRKRAIAIANMDGGYYRARHEFPSGYIGPLSLWEAVGGNSRHDDPEAVAIASPDDVRAQAIKNHEAAIEHAERWTAHCDLRLEYERAMLAEAGGTVAQRTGPEKGGACQCWATDRGRSMWSWIVKVNKVSVTVLDNWGNGGADFTRTIPFDKLRAVMTRADVDAGRQAGRIASETPRGFCLLDESPTPPPPVPSHDPSPEAETFEAMRDTLRAGVQVVTAPQLFPTPADVARQVIELADIRPGHRVLEPSAGTGALLDALPALERIVAVEINASLARVLRAKFRPERVDVRNADFLQCNGDLGTFDRIVMNPPFGKADDIRHIEHARRMLAPGGRLVAVCANGPRQQERLKPQAETWIDLPPDTFAGTSVRAAIVVIDVAP